MLQILDDGRVTGSHGPTVDFKKTVIIMTSNIGSQHLLDGVVATEVPESVEESVLTELRTHFRPEFINRVDETVIFKPLNLEEIEKIVGLLLTELNKTLADRRITVSLDNDAVAWIAEKGFDPVFGARPLKRFMQRSIQSSLARAIIEGEVQDGMEVVYSLEKDDLKLARVVNAEAV